MNYVVTTTWSHPAEMNKAEMAEFQQTFSDNPDLLNIYWFEIDPTTHGSVSIFRDKLLRSSHDLVESVLSHIESQGVRILFFNTKS